jgi:hypothetical protein
VLQASLHHTLLNLALAMVLCDDTFRQSHEFTRKLCNLCPFSMYIYKHKKNCQMRYTFVSSFVMCNSNLIMLTILLLFYIDSGKLLLYCLLESASINFALYPWAIPRLVFLSLLLHTYIHWFL